MSIRLDRNTDIRWDRYTEMKEGDTGHRNTKKLEPEKVKPRISLNTEHAVFRR